MSKDNLKYYTYQLDMKVLNILAIILFVILSAFVYFIGYDYGSMIVRYDLFTVFILLFLWLMLHEVIHGIGFAIFRSVDKKNIVFGMALEKGVFYCMCKQKIYKRIIFTSLLFPVTFIGVVTLGLVIIINNALLVYLSIFNIVGSIGDIMMSLYFLKCPNDVIYLDLDDCTSFTVLSNSDLSYIKVSGIKLVNNGIYNSKMIAHDKRRLVISRGSWYVLVIIFILTLIKVLGGIL